VAGGRGRGGRVNELRSLDDRNVEIPLSACNLDSSEMKWSKGFAPRSLGEASLERRIEGRIEHQSSRSGLIGVGDDDRSRIMPSSSALPPRGGGTMLVIPRRGSGGERNKVARAARSEPRIKYTRGRGVSRGYYRRDAVARLYVTFSHNARPAGSASCNISVHYVGLTARAHAARETNPRARGNCPPRNCRASRHCSRSPGIPAGGLDPREGEKSARAWRAASHCGAAV